MELFLLSTVTIGIAEIGDRSLFLAILFGVRYQRPWPVFWGMAAGLFLNQALSAVVGVWLFTVVGSEWHGWIVGVVFVVMAAWVLIPEDAEISDQRSARSIFLAAVLGFFILEMADKTQLAVVALAGASGNLPAVVLGATVGILLVTTPALLLGHRFAAMLPMRWIRLFASGLFLLLGLWTLMAAAGWMPDTPWLGLAPLLESS